MPLYEYQCKQCQQRMEKIQSFSAPHEKVCSKCGGELERVISAPAIQFKGAGWYVNDYAKSGGKTKPSDSSESKSEANSDGKSESASDSKSETSKDSGSKTPATSVSDSSSSAGSNASPASSSSSNSGSSSKSD